MIVWISNGACAIDHIRVACCRGGGRHEQTRDVGHHGCCDAWGTCHAEADAGCGPSEPGCDRALPRLRAVWAATLERVRSDRRPREVGARKDGWAQAQSHGES